MKKLLALLAFICAGNTNASPIDLNIFIPLINSDFREQKFQNTLKPYGSKFGIENVELGNTKFVMYKFQNDGFMLNVANNRVLSIVMYKEGEKGYRQFMGKMPLKVNFTMNRGQIEKVIGPPTECIAAQTVLNVKIDLSCSYSYAYPVNFNVAYDSLDSLDYQAKPLTMYFGLVNEVSKNIIKN
jgi:hypothetical protein